MWTVYRNGFNHEGLSMNKIHSILQSYDLFESQIEEILEVVETLKKCESVNPSKKLLQALENFRDATHELNTLLQQEDGEKLADRYPFEQDFNELTGEIEDWYQAHNLS